VITSPAVADGKVFFATSDSSLYHVADASSGKAIVRQQGKAYMFSSPAVAGDVVFIGVLNGTLEARDAKTGDLLWVFLSRSPSKTRVGYLPAIESLTCPSFIIPPGVKRRWWPTINKFASAEFFHRRLWLTASFTSVARTDFSTR
jgi:PQQ-like domain